MSNPIMPRLHEQTIIPICRHIRTNGARCGSAAIANQDLCYFHARVHRDHPAPLTAQEIVATWKDENVEGFRISGLDPMTVARAYPRQNEFNFPPLEDAESVQLAGSMLFHAIAQGHVHPVRARMLLDALRIVNSSMGRRPASDVPASSTPSGTVREVVLSPHRRPARPLRTTSAAAHNSNRIYILA